MNDRHSLKPSGLPRPSRLPVRASASALSGASTSASTPTTLPASRTAPALSNRLLRHTPSLSSLSVKSGSELRPPKLRSVASRDRLSLQSQSSASGIGGGLSQPSIPRTRAVSGQYVRAPRPPPSFTTPNIPTSRPSSSNAGSTATLPLTAPRPLARRASAQQLCYKAPTAFALTTPPTQTPSPTTSHSASPVDEMLASVHEEDGATTLRPRNVRARPSLSERTMETLAQIPSSPAVKGRSSSFYDGESSTYVQQRRGSSSAGSASRPGSSASRPQSRPGSSSLSAVPFGPIDEMPPPVAQTPGRLGTRTLRGPASRTSLNAAFQKTAAPLGTAVLSHGAPTPGRFGAKTVAARPQQSRSSVGRLFKKPSTSSLEMTKKRAEDATDATTANSRKSSAALREQIAKARAAKRAAAAAAEASQADADQPVEIAETTITETDTTDTAEAKQSPGSTSASPGAASTAPTSQGDADEPSMVPTDTTFDFGLNTDPFNTNRNQQTHTKVIQARAATARTSGRLNIAALGLREIPREVMDMYKVTAVGSSWAESVDLTRFVAADNELEMLGDDVFPDVDVHEMADNEEGDFHIFGGLETLDLHGNVLICLPVGLRRLQMLTALNLSQNRITNNAFEVLSQIPSLRDLKLDGNLFYGPLDPAFARLENLETVDLHGNNISGLPLNMPNMRRLRILNISENSFESLLFEPLSQLPLTELVVRKNKLSGVLLEDAVTELPQLQLLDVSSNQITHLVSPTRAHPPALPKLHTLRVSMNRLQSLPVVGGWTSLVTLAADENSISAVPVDFATLPGLRHADFSSNDIRALPAEIGRMESLTILRLSGNPLRDKKFCTAMTEEIKQVLAGRIVVEVKEEEEEEDGYDESRDAVTDLPPTEATDKTPGRRRSKTGTDDGSDDDFATPPTTPARSRAATLSSQPWPVKAGGILDRADTGSSALAPVVAARVAAAQAVREVLLQRNLFTAVPDALSFFADTLAVLSLARNQLTGETYLGAAGASEGLELPVLRELNLSANHITSLGPLVQQLRAPALQKLDVSVNRVAALPANGQLRGAFPALAVLLASDNRLAALPAESVAGLRVVDVTNNDIEHLDPRLGLLAGAGGLQRLDVLGNRFRVPRFSVLERGTEVTLRWLRGRVPVADMGAWREANAEASADEEVD